MGRLTEHRPRWTGTHATVQSPPDTMQKRKAQADTEAREGPGGAAAAQPRTVDSRAAPKGCERRSGPWTPALAKDPLTQSVSGLGSESLTDVVTAAHLEPVSAELQVHAVGAEPEVAQARKFSGDRAQTRRESTGELQFDSRAARKHQHTSVLCCLCVCNFLN